MHAVRTALAALALALIALAPAGLQAQGQPAAAGGAGLESLVIVSGGTRHAFQVEVMRTPDQRAKGLMFRKSLSPDGGMVFPMSPPRTASFWMENTFIPLDMLFVRTDGSIAMLAANTKPYSREDHK